MSLQTRISELAAAIGQDIKTLFGRSLPAGGSAGQVLAKSGSTDYAVGWVDAASGGGGGSGVPVYVQETEPAAASPYLWYRTNASGQVVDILKG